MHVQHAMRRALALLSIGALSAPALLPMGSSPAPVSTDDPLVPDSVLRDLEGAAKELAKRGRADALRSLYRILDELGHPEDARAKLEKTCDRSLGTRPEPASEVPKAARSVRRAVQTMARLLPDLDTSTADRLAAIVLRLDDSEEAAYLHLGHVAAQGGWVSPA